MTTIYFHVGMHKTGSSAFQRYCFHNRAALRTAGLAYPSLPFENHSHFLEAQFHSQGARAGRARAGEGSATTADDRESMRAAFGRDVRAASDKGLDMVVSGENATHLGHEGVAAAARFFRDLADRVIVLALVRPPMAFSRSIIQQALKGGGRQLEDFMKVPARPRYQRRFRPFLETFEDVRLRPFRQNTLVDGCALQTLLAMMDGDRSALRHARAPRLNDSVSLTAAKAFSLLNESLRKRALSDEFPEAVRRPLSSGFCGNVLRAAFRGNAVSHLPPAVRQAIAAVPGPPFVLPAGIARRIPRLAEDDAAWMSGVLGTDITDFDRKELAQAPPLAAFRRFDDGEVDALAKALEEVNQRIAGSRKGGGDAACAREDTDDAAPGL